MTRMRVKGIKRTRSTLADGRVVQYHYAWRGGPRFWCSDDGIKKGSPAYWAAYQSATSHLSPAHGKFRRVLTEFLNSRHFAKLAPRTQKDYRSSIFATGGIDEKFGSAPIGAFNSNSIRRIAYAWHDGFASDRVADTRKAHLVAIVSWAYDRGFVTHHHLTNMENRYSSARADVIWMPEEIDLFLYGDEQRDIDPAKPWLWRIFVTALETGLRPGDLARLAIGHIRPTKQGRRIYMTTEKRGRDVSIPVTPLMSDIIDETPHGQFIILADERGRAYSDPNSLGQAVSRRRDECGIRKELRLYDARGNAATRLYNADASLREIAAHMGWSVAHTSKMIETYVHMSADATDDLLEKLEKNPRAAARS